MRKFKYGAAALVVTLFSISAPASAGQITTRKVVLGSSVASASTTYAFTLTAASATAIKSVSFDACTTAAGSCTPAPGFSASSSSLTGQPTNLGAASGWTVSTATAGSLRLLDAANATAPTAGINISFSGVVNPSATNSTFFLRGTTYSDSGWTTPIDAGTVAASTAGQVTVTANVDEALTFTIGAQTVPLGSLTTSSTGSGTSTMTASTNAGSGYSITVAGTTLAGPSSLTAATGIGSTVNTKEFGLNLVANTTPSVGTAASGGGTGTAFGAYATANSYKFLTGDIVASASIPTNSNTFTTSYIANVDGSTLPGAYSTVLTYNAIANF